MYARVHPTPIGDILITADGNALTGLFMTVDDAALARSEPSRSDIPVLRAAAEQLDEYFAGERRDFDLPLAPRGTPFQQHVWAELRRIPFGATISYAELAIRVGKPGAARAVGQANGRNPIGIIIPCHRVIAADGGIGGYSAGLDRKEWLLRHEAAFVDVAPKAVKNRSAA